MTNENDYYDKLPVKPRLYAYEASWYSDRHRLYGYNAPALDIDFFMIEYDKGLPAALIEAKHINAQNVRLDHPSFRAMKVLADNSKIPFLITYYDPETACYYIVPMNDHARAIPLCDKPRWFTEKNYVKMLYWLRKKNVPADILNNLSSTAPIKERTPSYVGNPL